VGLGAACVQFSSLGVVCANRSILFYSLVLGRCPFESSPEWFEGPPPRSGSALPSSACVLFLRSSRLAVAWHAPHSCSGTACSSSFLFRLESLDSVLSLFLCRHFRSRCRALPTTLSAVNFACFSLRHSAAAVITSASSFGSFPSVHCLSSLWFDAPPITTSLSAPTCPPVSFFTHLYRMLVTAFSSRRSLRLFSAVGTGMMNTRLVALGSYIAHACVTHRPSRRIAVPLLFRPPPRLQRHWTLLFRPLLDVANEYRHPGHLRRHNPFIRSFIHS